MKLSKFNQRWLEMINSPSKGRFKVLQIEIRNNKVMARLILYGEPFPHAITKHHESSLDKAIELLREEYLLQELEVALKTKRPKDLI